MSNHGGFRYLFNQLNLNCRQAQWLAMIHELNFEIDYIKGKENGVEYTLNKRIQVNNRSYELLWDRLTG